MFNFIKAYFKCSNSEVVNRIKDFAGISGDDIKSITRLSATESCRKYKKKSSTRKQSKCTVLPEDYMDRYTYDLSLMKSWTDEGITEESLKHFGVKYDSFSNRLVYPIRDIMGNIVNVGGRTLDPYYKEKKLRKYTYFFQWGSMEVIYGLFENMDEIMKRKEVIIFEGAKSVMLSRSWGIKNTGAILTSHLNPAQMKLLASLGVTVVFGLDKDVMIREDKNIMKLKRYVNVEYLWDRYQELDDKDAPVDKGLEVFNRLYDYRIKYR